MDLVQHNQAGPGWIPIRLLEEIRICHQALLVGDQQGWLTTEGFLDKVAENLTAAMSKS
jgi:isocitrate dehydrogenase